MYNEFEVYVEVVKIIKIIIFKFYLLENFVKYKFVLLFCSKEVIVFLLIL